MPKFAFSSNQRCETQPTPFNLYPNEYSQGLHYYPFGVNLDRYVGSCNTLDDISNTLYVPNKSKELKLFQNDYSNK